ncbi:uncharacterized protein LOC116250299 isoform X2 [Nymphaea colorata]|uniref:uncharacterized protein LOC116250299 isoform X2 n=1 Tax=Nymphaea colorata TaxID=210225 RepID=UPI00214E7F9F|nr:uncharacterized protein LOC116250299 isoform X2 [Nymphaea colorata]
MLPVCSATVAGSHHPQVYFSGGLRNPGLGRWLVEEKYLPEEKLTFFTSSGVHARGAFSKVHATKFDFSYVERYDPSHQKSFDEDLLYMNSIGNSIEGRIYYIDDALDTSESSSIPRTLDDASSSGTSLMNEITKPNTTGSFELPPEPANSLNEFTSQNGAAGPETFPSIELQSVGPGEPSNFASVPLQDGENMLSDSVVPESSSLTQAPTEAISDAVKSFQENVQLFYSGINDAIDTSITKLNHTLNDAYNEITSSFMNNIQSATDSLVSSVDKTGEQASSKVTDVSGGLIEATFKAGGLTVFFLRKGIVAVEDALENVGDLLGDSYGSIKNALPSEAQAAVTLSEENAKQILRPLLAAFQKVYLAIEGLERNVGLDPNDPIVPFLLLVGSTASLGIVYWLFNYGGYSGDLSPDLALKELTEEQGTVLIDVRPEDLRARDGVPDLRRGARFRYASVDLPKLDDSVRKLLKSDIDEILLAAVVRNLKIVNNNSKVIVMDADGSESKSIARSLRKLGVRATYLLQGGFGSWVANGLRIKDLKPETALTILNEETEAILEDIKPTPAKVFVAGLGLIAAIYAITEWEITLQLIGIIGLGQALYRRVSSYEDSEDLKEDVRLLLSPVRFGAQALAWTMTKLEPNKVGLPTSPSTTAVQNRVLQAAAKHGTLPLELEDAQDATSLGDSNPSSLKDNLDPTEA